MSIEWKEGAPGRLESGMLIETEAYGVKLVGDFNTAGVGSHEHKSGDKVIRWAWVIQPYELDWIVDMAAKHRKKH